MNARKLYGLLLCAAGVGIVRSTGFFSFSGPQAFVLTALGVLLACIGLAVFASGITARIEKKIRVCGSCFYKNDASSTTCARCKKTLLHQDPGKRL